MAEVAAQGVEVGAGAGEEQLQGVEGGEAAVLAEPEARINRGTRGDACCDTTQSRSKEKRNFMRN